MFGGNNIVCKPGVGKSTERSRSHSRNPQTNRTSGRELFGKSSHSKSIPLDGKTVRNNDEIMHSDTTKAKGKFKQMLNNATFGLTGFMFLVDFLMGLFAHDEKPSEYNEIDVTENMVCERLKYIFTGETIEDADVKLFIRMCCPSEPYGMFHYGQYTSVFSDVTSGTQYEVDYFDRPKSISELNKTRVSALIESSKLQREKNCNEFKNDIAKEIYNNSQNFAHKEIYDASWKDIQNKIYDACNNGIINNSTKDSLLLLISVINIANDEGINQALDFIGSIIGSIDDEVIKEFMSSVQQQFPGLYIRIVNSVPLKEEKQREFSSVWCKSINIHKPFDGNDLCGLDMSGWNIQRRLKMSSGPDKEIGAVELYTLTSLEGCIMDEQTSITVVGPKLDGNTDNQLEQLSQWIAGCEETMNTADHVITKNNFLKAFKLKIANGLINILINSDAGKDVHQKCKNIADKYKWKFERIVEIAMEDPGFNHKVMCNKKEQKINKHIAQLKQFVNSQQYDEASELIRNIITQYSYYGESIFCLFQEACIGGRRDYSGMGALTVEYFNVISRNGDFDDGYKFSKRIPLFNSDQHRLNFTDKDISGFEIYSLSLEVCTSFSKCIADSETSIELKMPDFSNEFTIEMWINQCAKVIKTAQNEHLISKLKKEVICVINSQKVLTREKRDDLKQKFNAAFVKNSQEQKELTDFQNNGDNAQL